MQTNQLSAIPEFFRGVDLPAVAKWAADKVREHDPDPLEVDGRAVTVRSWYFEGSFPRKVRESVQQWDVPETGRQYLCAVRCRGGHYRGQRPTVLVAFTEYASVDGKPLPR